MAPHPFVPARRFQLLAQLALPPGQWVERDRIAALLRPEHALADARHNLRKVVHRAHACAAAARRLLAVDPLDEPAMQTLLQAELRQGHAAEARAEYRRYSARLAQELGVEPARVLRELVRGTGLGATAGLAVETSPAAAAPAAAGDDGFIGRRLELAEAQALLARPEARCLTLLGSGGIGKSRLAQQLSLRCAALFPGGVRWVEQQDTSTLAAALARLALALGDCSLPLLSSLVDKSLVAVDAAGRFSLHPVVAAQASARLATQAGAAQSARLRHAEHHAAGLGELAPLMRTDPGRLVQGVLLEAAHTWSAWHGAVAVQRVDHVLVMLPELRLVYELRGRLVEGLAVTQTAIAPARACGETAAAIGCLGILGHCTSAMGENRAARPFYRQALALARRLGERHVLAVMLGNLGIAEKRLGNFTQAQARYEEALAMARELGDRNTTAVHLNNLAALDRDQGRWVQGLQRLQEMLWLCRQRGRPAGGMGSSAPRCAPCAQRGCHASAPARRRLPPRHRVGRSGCHGACSSGTGPVWRAPGGRRRAPRPRTQGLAGAG